MAQAGRCENGTARWHTPLRRLLVGAALSLVTLLAGGIGGAQTITLSNNHPVGTVMLTRRAAGGRALELHLYFSPKNRAALDRLLADQQDAVSPRYHRWLTPAEFDARFGRSSAEIAALQEWLSARGFTVTEASPVGITVTATVAAAQAAFATRIATSDDGAVFANLTDPQIPVQFAGLIGSITGLDNLTHSVALNASAVRTPNFNNGIGDAFGPADLYTFYDETPLLNAGTDGAGNGCLAVIEDSDFLDSAVTLFDSTFTLPAAAVTRVMADHSSPGRNGDEVEALLDIEWAHAVAPAGPIDVYIGNGANGLVDAIRAAVSDDRCGAISVSYGFCGSPGNFYTGTLDSMFAQAAAQGQSFFVSSGDEGAAGLVLNASGTACAIGTSANVSEMSADPNVTAVGGTEFTPNYSGDNDLGSVAESAWNDDSGASGGGASHLFDKPGYQQAATPADGKRDVPDVSFGASPFSPGFYWANDNGGAATLTCCIGGTSIAAPMWAGLTTLITQLDGGRIGNLNPRIYALGALANSAASGIRDVTSGNNDYNGVLGFTAAAGYNQATGWGTADMATFAAAYGAGASPTPTAAATPAPGTPTLRASRRAVSFPAQIVIGSQGVTSPARIVNLFNPRNRKSNAPINLASVVAAPAGEFAIAQSSCGSVIEPGTGCSIAIDYTPTAPGPQTGDLTITSDAANSPLEIEVTGRGKPGKLRITSRVLKFGAQQVGTAASRTIVLTNLNPLPISISAITLSDTTHYALGGDCGATIISNGGTCAITVSLSPDAPSPLEPAMLTIEDDAADSPQIVQLDVAR